MDAIRREFPGEQHQNAIDALITVYLEGRMADEELDELLDKYREQQKDDGSNRSYGNP